MLFVLKDQSDLTICMTVLTQIYSTEEILHTKAAYYFMDELPFLLSWVSFSQNVHVALF